MESKIRIKTGQIEIDFEGSESFLKEDLLKFLKEISEIAGSNRSGVDGSLTALANDPIGQEKTNQSENNISGTTNTIAAKLNVKKGPELIIAAAAHLSFVKKQSSFHRSDILKEMQSASNYYSKHYLNNLNRSLKMLVKNHSLVEQKKDIYALPSDAAKELEARLAQ